MLDDPESSVNQKLTEAHYTSLFHILAAPCTNSESSESRSWSRKTIYRVNLCKKTVKTATANVCLVAFFIVYIYIYILYTHTQTCMHTLHQKEMEHNRMPSAKCDRSVHEVARSTSIHIRHDILTAIKPQYLATLWSWINQLTLY